MPEKQESKSSILNFIVRNSLAVAVLAVVLGLFVPLNKTAIDLAMVLNFGLAFSLLLIVINMKRAADFTSFPRVTLISTIFGLAINVASTRNILGNPVTASLSKGMAEQSEIVKSFAGIVAGNNVLIGFIIFIILTVVQVLVISKGAERVSEVTARFTLDAMNTKKFALQNKLNTGSITQEEFDEQDAALDRQIDFYAAMDGASKFVSGNVKAGIFITVVNLIGGIATGMIAGSSMVDALNSYAKLTIGDGLTSQLPSLMLSFSTGLLITTPNDGNFLSQQLKKQFSFDGNIYIIVGAALAVIGIAFHSGATPVLVLVGLAFVFIGYRLSKVNKEEAQKAEIQKQTSKNAPKSQGPEEVSPIAKLDDLSLEVGFALVPLVDKEKGAELLERVKRIRREAALDLGLVIPPIHIMDQMELPTEEYSFKIRGIEIGRGRLKMGHFMCLNTGAVPKDREIAGEKTREPAFGMEAVWIPESKRLEAEKAGYAVVDAPTTIATHLTELIRKNAASILSMQAVHAMLEEIRKTNSVVVDAVLNDQKFTYDEVEAVLKNLLNEQVSIRNMVTILETLAVYGRMSHDPWMLTDKVREALGAQICQQYVDGTGVLHVVSFTQGYAQKILDHRAEIPGQGPTIAFDPVDGRNFIGNLSSTVAAVQERGMMPILMCPVQIRRMVKAATEREMPGLVVLSVNEVMAAGKNIKIESLGEIDG